MEDLSKYERIPFIEFDENDYEYLVDKCMLNDELSTILKMKIYGESNTKIADTLGLAEATLSRRIKILKKKIKRVL